MRCAGRSAWWARSLVLLAILWRLLRPLAQLERAQHLFDAAQALHEGWPEAGGEIGRLARAAPRGRRARAQLESFNAQVMRKLSSVMAAAPVGICFTRDKRFVLVSAEFCRLFGRSEAEMLGQPASSIYASNEDHQAIGRRCWPPSAKASPTRASGRCCADGTRFWGQLRGRPVADGDASAGTIWSIVDISEQIAARAQLEWSASHDVLTGLCNRKVLAQLSRTWWKRCRARCRPRW